jgi:methyl-accepting chemotaxis protein/methyl-accepting chemotaxis protein-1 (serine sensor receptor)
LSNWTLGKKLFACFGVTGAIALALGIVSWISMDAMRADMERLSQTYTRARYLAGRIDIAATDTISASRGVLLSAMLQDEAGAKSQISAYREALQRVGNYTKEVRPLLTSAGGFRLVGDLESRMPALESMMTEVQQALAASDLIKAQEIQAKRLNGAAVEVKATADKLTKEQNRLIELIQAESAAAVAARRVLILSLIGLSALALIGVTLVVRSSSRVLQEIAAELDSTARQVSGAAAQVSRSSQALAQDATRQAASIEETSAAGEEVRSMAERNSSNSMDMARVVGQSQERTIQARKSLEAMVSSMAAITDSSGRISKIISVIEQIAFQTNILALNAAVEAARAGEAGQGFAVVADEVRSLAQRCAQAAKDTAQLISDSRAKTDEGRARTDEVSSLIRTIAEDANQVRQLVDEVATGSQEQTRGLVQIAAALQDMQNVTTRGAAGAEETAAASDELNSQSKMLSDLVDRLGQMVDSSSERRALVPASRG